jgi:hypothetical protein
MKPSMSSAAISPISSPFGGAERHHHGVPGSRRQAEAQAGNHGSRNEQPLQLGKVVTLLFDRARERITHDLAQVASAS